MAENDAAFVLDESRQSMEKAVRSLRVELQRVRTGRANTAILDGLQIEYYGSLTPLNQLANLGTPDPRLIVISPFDKSVLQAIEKAIQTSDLGLTPANDGKVVRIPIPPLTEERRKDLVRHVRKGTEEHKVGVREARREGVSMLKDMESEGALPADERRRADKRIQDLTDEYVKKIDDAIAQKEKEVLQV